MKMIITTLTTALMILLVGGIVSASNYLDPLTKGRADNLYCTLKGCTMKGDIDMNNNSIINAYWINVTLINASEIINMLWEKNTTQNTINPKDLNVDVGIGTNSPSQKLHIKGNILIEDDDSKDTVAIIGNSGDDGWINLYQNTVSKILLHSNSISYFYYRWQSIKMLNSVV